MPPALAFGVAPHLRQRLSVAVNLDLDLLGGETVLALAALDALVALADARAQTAEVGAVASAPGPAAHVRRVDATQRVAA